MSKKMRSVVKELFDKGPYTVWAIKFSLLEIYTSEHASILMNVCSNNSDRVREFVHKLQELIGLSVCFELIDEFDVPRSVDSNGNMYFDGVGWVKNLSNG